MKLSEFWEWLDPGARASGPDKNGRPHSALGMARLEMEISCMPREQSASAWARRLLVHLQGMDTPTEEIEWHRAAGDCVCEKCKKPYADHPHCWNAGVCLTGVPTLRQLCDGSLVKL